MQFNITFKTIFEYILKKLVLCIHIRFVSTKKTTRIASRASCYASNCAKVYLSILFTSFISHGYLPDRLMESAIIPTIKNKIGDKNNYRSIALVTAMSKIFELCLSEKLNDYLTTSDNQFGFKAKHSADMCIYAVKSVVKYYNHYESPMYTCFLDASKAFDGINSLDASL